MTTKFPVNRDRDEDVHHSPSTARTVYDDHARCFDSYMKTPRLRVTGVSATTQVGHGLGSRALRSTWTKTKHPSRVRRLRETIKKVKIKIKAGSRRPGDRSNMSTVPTDDPLDSSAIQLGLEKVSDYIRANHHKHTDVQLPVRIIIAGGAVSVLYLHNRATTEDIDYCPEYGDDEFSWMSAGGTILLAEAAVAAGNALSLADGWFNSGVASYILAAGLEELAPLFQRSVDQDVALFRSDALICYAAQWEWQLAQKLKRIANSNYARDKDISDAQCLAQLLIKRDGGDLSRTTIRDWYPTIGQEISDKAFALAGIN